MLPFWLSGRRYKGTRSHTAERHWRRVGSGDDGGIRRTGTRSHTAERHWRLLSVLLSVLLLVWAPEATQPKGIGDGSRRDGRLRGISLAPEATQPKGIGDSADQ